MVLLSQVQALKSAVTLAGPASPTEQTLNLLQRLHGLGPLSLDILRQTLVGREVNELRKRAINQDVRRGCSNLLRLWKEGVHPKARRASNPKRLTASSRPQLRQADPVRRERRSSQVHRLRRRRRSSAATTLVIDLERTSQEDKSAEAASRRVHPRGTSSSAQGLPCDECVVCMDKECTHAFAPCGHQCVCGDCSRNLLRKGLPCPLCRASVKLAIQIFKR